MTQTEGSPGRGRRGGARKSAPGGTDKVAPPDAEALRAAWAEIEQARRELDRRLLAETRDHLSDRVMDAMSEALFLLDIEGKVILVNEAGRALLGLGDHELLGVPFAECQPGTAIPSTPLALLRIDPAGRPVQLETTVRNTRGHTVPVGVSATMVRDSTGLAKGLLLTARDLTDRVAVEQALAQKAQELTRSNEELQRFAYVASHDLQEPLRTVASFVQLLHARYRDQLDADAREFIAFAVDGARRMQGLIDGLLTYAHVQTRAKPFAPTPCEAVLANVKANLHLAIAESGAVITNDALPIVVADQLQMVQLFQNLVGNALKYRAKEAPRIHIGSRTEKKEWFFSVRDNGIGLDMKFAQRVFVVFQRLHSIEEYQGTGIGLSICKRIVERHGGRIWVESVPDQGATFSFTISRAPA